MKNLIKGIVTAGSVLAIVGMTPAFAQTRVEVNGEAAVKATLKAPVSEKEALNVLRAGSVEFKTRRASANATERVSAERLRLQQITDVLRVRLAGAERTEMEVFRGRVESAASEAELKKIARDIRDARRDDRREKIGKFIDKVEAAISSAADRSDRIAKVLRDLASQGKEVATLDAELAAANVEIAAARESLVSMKTVMQGEISEARIKEMRTTLKSIKDHLKNAYESFRTIAKGVQSL
jgi:hypothetical protein